MMIEKQESCEDIQRARSSSNVWTREQSDVSSFMFFFPLFYPFLYIFSPSVFSFPLIYSQD